MAEAPGKEYSKVVACPQITTLDLTNNGTFGAIEQEEAFEDLTINALLSSAQHVTSHIIVFSARQNT